MTVFYVPLKCIGVCLEASHTMVLNVFKCPETIKSEDPEGFQSEASVLFAHPSLWSFTIGLKFSKFRRPPSSPRDVLTGAYTLEHYDILGEFGSS